MEWAWCMKCAPQDNDGVVIKGKVVVLFFSRHEKTDSRNTE